MAKDDRIEKYKIGLQLALNEGHVLWSFSQAYLVANTIIFAFISQRMSQSNLSIQPDFWTFILSLSGLIITALWLSSYIRRSDYYKFRIAHLNDIEPNGWNFVKGKGKDFSDGKDVTINGKTYRIGFLGRPRTKHISIIFIFLFILIYTFLLYITFPFEFKFKTTLPANNPKCFEIDNAKYNRL